MKSPKERFLEDKSRVTEWNSIADSGLFQQSLDYAMLEYVERETFKVGPVYDAQAVAHRVEGARLFARLLANLGIVEPVRKTSEPSRLEYEHFDVQPGMKPAGLDIPSP